MFFRHYAMLMAFDATAAATPPRRASGYYIFHAIDRVTPLPPMLRCHAAACLL